MTRIKTQGIYFLLSLFISFSVLAQSPAALPRSIPELEGVSSAGISEFIDAVGKTKNEMHSLMVLRHGKVVAETWWAPYRADLRHTMYSCSKSFTATAIGLAVAEKRLDLEDKVISFFPGDQPDSLTPFLEELNIKHLLTMSVGHAFDPTFAVASKQDNWVKGFLAIPITFKPGTRFLYNSLATYMLSAIIQKVTGQKLVDYLQSRLFEPLGIAGADWEADPMGINVGGWGLRIKTEDMAKLGQLFLQKGQWNGRQVLPASWVEAASSAQILQHPEWPSTRRDSSDWEQGYGYQMWRCRNNAYRGDGAFGQYIIVLPDQDAVIAITSETTNMQDELNLVWKYLLPSFKSEKQPWTKATSDVFQQKLKTLKLPLTIRGVTPIRAKSIATKTYAFSPNTQFMKSVQLQFKEDVCRVHLKIDADTFNFSFGNGRWVAGETNKLGPNLVMGARGHFNGLAASKIAGSYRWKGDTTLELSLRYIESPHTETWVCLFGQDKISVEVQNSFDKNRNFTMKGVIQNTPQPVSLIVRGDDMGFSHSGNLALIKSFKEGIQTSIEVIVPSPWFPEAVQLLEQYPGIDVGVHLAITSEWDNVKWRPLTAASSIQDPDGYFYPMVFPNKNYPGRSIRENKWKLEDIEKEFRAQIELAIKKIPRVSHLSSHMGCTQVGDEVKAMTKRLAREYKLDIDTEEKGVKYMRYDGPRETGEDKIQSFINGLKALEAGQTYLFVDHPGLDDAELRAIHHIGYDQVAKDRQGVTDLFTSSQVKTFIQKNGIRLISYKDLATVK